MGKFIDMTGWIMSEHGVPDSRLKIINKAEDKITPSGNILTMWMVQCNCGSEPFKASGSNIRSGHTLSCGCIQKERAISKLKKYNKYDLSGKFGVGWTSNTNKEFYFDLEDYDLIKNYCWSEVLVGLNGNFSTLRACIPANKGGGNISMHQLLGYINCDHIDRNEFNNTKENLRRCTNSQNSSNCSLSRRNKTGITGVAPLKYNKWQAILMKEGVYVLRKSFDTKTEAIIARLKAEKEYLGEFAPQKHLFEEYGLA